ncbi:tumor protein p53-inducible protein 11-like isoform X5 [Petromyzon marinus]|nr:tumor protein p53-inducible protein 11-like isoform X5 [Petromyzon marinus]
MATKTHGPLLKKHSQTDLLSRLKTRKILGVGGEDDDGEIHRSKISQVLGNEQKFTVRQPVGLRAWQVLSALMFTSLGLVSLAAPEAASQALSGEEDVGSRMATRLYGGALLSLSLTFWNSLYTSDKAVIRWSLLTEVCFYAIQLVVTSMTLWERGSCPASALLYSALRVAFLLVSLVYYFKIGRRWRK